MTAPSGSSPLSVAASGADPIAVMRSRMTADALDRSGRIARMNASYIETDLDGRLDRALDRMIGNVAAFMPGAPFDESVAKERALFIIGDSGAGKSTSVKRLLARRPEFQPYADQDGNTVNPVLYIEAPRPLTLKLLARKGLEKMGYPVRKDMQENLIWDLFKEQARFRGVLFVFIDEMQHVMRGTTEREAEHMGDVFKSMLQVEDWPMHAIFSGMPVLAQFRMQNMQLRNRSAAIVIDPVDAGEDGEYLLHVVQTIIRVHAELKAGKGVGTQGFIQRLVHACDGGFGTLIQFTRSAVTRTIHGGRGTVALEDFADAYADITGCVPATNVMTASDWRQIRPDQALAELLGDRRESNP